MNIMYNKRVLKEIMEEVNGVFQLVISYSCHNFCVGTIVTYIAFSNCIAMLMCV